MIFPFLSYEIQPIAQEWTSTSSLNSNINPRSIIASAPYVSYNNHLLPAKHLEIVTENIELSHTPYSMTVISGKTSSGNSFFLGSKVEIIASCVD
jgi:hypothetical protein